MTMPSEPAEPVRDISMIGTEVYSAARACIAKLQELKQLLKAKGVDCPIDEIVSFIDARYAEVIEPAVMKTLAFLTDPTTTATVRRSQINPPTDLKRPHDHLTVQWHSQRYPGRKLTAQFDLGRSSQREMRTTDATTLSRQLISLVATGDVRMFVPRHGNPSGEGAMPEQLAPLLNKIADVVSSMEAVRTPRLALQHQTQLASTGPPSVVPRFDTQARSFSAFFTTNAQPMSEELASKIEPASEQLENLYAAYRREFPRQLSYIDRMRGLMNAASWIANEGLALRYGECYSMMEQIQAAYATDTSPEERLEKALASESLAEFLLEPDSPEWIDIKAAVGTAYTAAGRHIEAAGALYDALRLGRSHDHVATQTYRATKTARAYRLGGRPLAALSVLDEQRATENVSYEAEPNFAVEYVMTASALELPDMALEILNEYFDVADKSVAGATYNYEVEVHCKAIAALYEQAAQHQSYSTVLERLGKVTLNALQRLPDDGYSRKRTLQNLSDVLPRMASALRDAGKGAAALNLLDAACDAAEHNGVSALLPRLYEGRIALALEVAPARIETLVDDYKNRIEAFDAAPQAQHQPLPKRVDGFVEMAEATTTTEKRDWASFDWSAARSEESIEIDGRDDGGDVSTAAEGRGAGDVAEVLEVVSDESDLVEAGHTATPQSDAPSTTDASDKSTDGSVTPTDDSEQVTRDRPPDRRNRPARRKRIGSLSDETRSSDERLTPPSLMSKSDIEDLDETLEPHQSDSLDTPDAMPDQTDSTTDQGLDGIA